VCSTGDLFDSDVGVLPRPPMPALLLEFPVAPPPSVPLRPRLPFPRLLPEDTSGTGDLLEDVVDTEGLVML